MIWGLPIACNLLLVYPTNFVHIREDVRVPPRRHSRTPRGTRTPGWKPLLYGLPKFQLDKLQRIQNSAARLVSLSKKCVHITPIIQELHWLPVEQRIQYKLLLLTFKALTGQAPTYIRDLISIKEQTRTLRSNSSVILNHRPVRTISYGERSFSNAAPQLWNRLPTHVKNSKSLEQFKNLLKTYLFHN